MSSDAAEQLPVHLPNESLAQRKLGEELDAALERPNIVEDLPLIFSRHPRLGFGRQNLAERRLCSFYSRAGDCFATQVWLNEEMWIRKP